MSKDQKYASDVLRSVLKKSVIARVNPSFALARFWKSQGVELTSEQMLQIQLLDKQYKPQTILREYSRQIKRASYRKDEVTGLDRRQRNVPLEGMLEDTKPKSPRRFLGFLR